MLHIVGLQGMQCFDNRGFARGPFSGPFSLRQARPGGKRGQRHAAVRHHQLKAAGLRAATLLQRLQAPKSMPLRSQLRSCSRKPGLGEMHEMRSAPSESWIFTVRYLNLSARHVRYPLLHQAAGCGLY
ncbi:hypothetical protein TSOC_010059 [Tetrabaena socialis]|uniref:Uncharacterized protein n=1 Tax=Tetrabaena socialis TaxID=47790 RepID=A0A2J7ZUC4_9CHLO|nr:hypothetical protein TSOC_010059 [Tetrabaena socialis]|eukprot:PNH03848.1 hypothetical protein TSOC_010059 [Tetrabaena socialis]